MNNDNTFAPRRHQKPWPTRFANYCAGERSRRPPLQRPAVLLLGYWGWALTNIFAPMAGLKRWRGLMRHEIPFVREVALLNRPLPLDDATVATVAEMIKDEFAPVQGAACHLAAKVKATSLSMPLAEVLKTTKNVWVLQATFWAANDCGLENDRRLEICVSRLEPRNNDWNMVLMRLLVGGVIESHGSGAETSPTGRVFCPVFRPPGVNSLVLTVRSFARECGSRSPLRH